MLRQANDLIVSFQFEPVLFHGFYHFLLGFLLHLHGLLGLILAGLQFPGISLLDPCHLFLGGNKGIKIFPFGGAIQEG